MVDAYAGNNTEITIDDIYRVEASTQTDLQNRVIEFLTVEACERGENGVLEVVQLHIVSDGFYRFKTLDQSLVTHLFALNPDPFVKDMEVRRQSRANTSTGGQ